MATVRLTEAQAKAATAPESGERWYWDNKLKGFGLRVRAGGSKTFWIKYRTPGDLRTKKVRIGVYMAGNTLDAREKAKDHLAKIALGADPAAELRKQRLGETVSEMFPHYLDALALKRKAKTLLQYRWLFKNHIGPALGKMKVAEVGRKDISRLHLALKDLPTTANRAVAVLSAFFGWAIKAGYREAVNPAASVEKYPEQKVGQRMDTEQVKSLWSALQAVEDEGEHPIAIAALRFLVVTGFRPTEAFDLQWQEVDLAGSWVRLKDSKTGESGRPLNILARGIVAGLERGEGTRRVFGGPEGQSLADVVRRVWARGQTRNGVKREGVRARANLPNTFRLYDVRHAYLSLGASIGISAPLLQKVAGHADFKTTERYVHLDGDNQVKEAAEQIGSQIAQALGIEVEPKVIPLRVGLAG